MINEPDKIFNTSTCGDNRAKWILEIGRQKDVTINLRHLMGFGKNTEFEIKIKNGRETVHSMKELIPVASKYLNAMEQGQRNMYRNLSKGKACHLWAMV